MTGKRAKEPLLILLTYSVENLDWQAGHGAIACYSKVVWPVQRREVALGGGVAMGSVVCGRDGVANPIP